MYDVIKFSNNSISSEIELDTIDNILESSNSNKWDKLFTEAVFANGKKTVEPIQEIMDKLKEKFDAMMEVHKAEVKAYIDKKHKELDKSQLFDPVAFWRDPLWKDFEDSIQKVFGFRKAEVHVLPEQYKITTTNPFQTGTMNCYVYRADRFPIEGLVTEKGFYDKSHSLSFRCEITLGLFNKLTSKEIMGVLLHEFGHCIDPALMTVSYTETNILTKYLTDRKKEINKNEKKVLDNSKYLKFGIFSIMTNLSAVKNSIVDTLFGFFTRSSGEKSLKKIKELLHKDKSRFSRQEYSEAYADNFARMYGYGYHVMSGINKIEDEFDFILRSRYKKEKARQEAITKLTMDMLKDEHKTHVHRIRALLREYNDEIKDPNTPDIIKKQLTEDRDELEKLLDAYLNNYSDFQNNINKMINEELKKMEEKFDK